MVTKSAFLALLAAPLLALGAVPAQAGDRYVSGVPLEQVDGVATYGPFRVIDGQRAALVGITDERSPAQFSAMLRDYPELAVLELIECPGTFDDLANLQLGRLIRKADLETHVPRGGSVRSGAVELFLAGAERRIDDGARFAVHAWEDESGRQATDYALTAPQNMRYISYYRDMGMNTAEAQAFYAMTNSVSFESALWLNAQEMRYWVQPAEKKLQAAPVALDIKAEPPRLAYIGLAELDLGALLN